MADLDALEALVRRMTPGPWAVDDDECGTGFGPFRYVEHEEDDWPKPDLDRANADRVAALRSAHAAEELIAVARAAAPWQAGERCCPSSEVAASRSRGPCAPCVLAYALDALDARLRGEREVER